MGYCTEQFCQTHAAMPTVEAEEQLWDEGDTDFCVHVVRLGSPADWEVNIQGYKDAT
jgi:hypothetical protein